ncbi:hypothetical protein FRC03_002962 [Tulasnella sp. 419]|nr:hypothetical protein FRC03_002962 [Tulasnella sp. 419]
MPNLRSGKEYSNIVEARGLKDAAPVDATAVGGAVNSRPENQVSDPTPPLLANPFLSSEEESFTEKEALGIEVSDLLLAANSAMPTTMDADHDDESMPAVADAAKIAMPTQVDADHESMPEASDAAERAMTNIVDDDREGMGAEIVHETPNAPMEGDLHPGIETFCSDVEWTSTPIKKAEKHTPDRFLRTRRH